jgi:hypothetical protein
MLEAPWQKRLRNLAENHGHCHFLGALLAPLVATGLGEVGLGTLATTSILGATVPEIAGGVLGGAALGAATSGFTGGNPLLGALGGGLSGGIGSFGPALGAATGIGEVGGDIAAGVAGGALSSVITGSSPLTGALTGGAGGALSGIIGPSFSNLFGSGGATATAATAPGGGASATSVPGGAAGSAAALGDIGGGSDFGGGGDFAPSGGGGPATPGSTAVSSPGAISGGGGAISGGGGGGTPGPVSGASTTASTTSSTSGGGFLSNLFGGGGGGASYPGWAPGTGAGAGIYTNLATGVTSDVPGASIPSGMSTAAGGGGLIDTLKGDIGSGISKLISNPLALVSGGILASQMFGGSDTSAADKALQQQATSAASTAQMLQAPLTSGALPPGAQASLDLSQENQEAVTRSAYASMGMGGGTGEGDAFAAIAQRIADQRVGIEESLFQQAGPYAQLATNDDIAILNQQRAEDQQFSGALMNFVAALAGGRSGRTTAA